MRAQVLWLQTIYFGKVSQGHKIFEDSWLSLLSLASKHHAFLYNLESGIAFTVALVCDVPATVVQGRDGFSEAEIGQLYCQLFRIVWLVLVVVTDVPVFRCDRVCNNLCDCLALWHHNGSINSDVIPMAPSAFIVSLSSCSQKTAFDCWASMAGSHFQSIRNPHLVKQCSAVDALTALHATSSFSSRKSTFHLCNAIKPWQRLCWEVKRCSTGLVHTTATEDESQRATCGGGTVTYFRHSVVKLLL